MTENMTCLSKISSTSNSLVENITATGGELLRRGPWTLEEDELLVRYVNVHGEGRWNLLAKRSGLKRTGKSCRLRWLNYLKPDVKRGNFTTQEQILILQLHSKWGNRWSRIAQHLPGRTDNEIKNYWRTRVQKQARHLRVDPNSKTFQNIVQFLWMPRLLQMIDNDNTSPSLSPSSSSPNNPTVQDHHHDQLPSHHSPCPSPLDSNTSHVKIQSFDHHHHHHHHHNKEFNNSDSDQTTGSKNCSVSSSGPSNILSGRNGLQYITISSSSNSTSLIEDFDYVDNYSNNNCYNMVDFNSTDYSCQMAYGDWTRYDHLADDTWNMDGLWQFRTSLV